MIAPDEVCKRHGQVVTASVGDGRLCGRRVGIYVAVATLGRRRLAEGVTEAMHGPDKTGMNCVIAERLADFAHQIREVFLHHEGAGPEAVLQLGPGERLGMVFDQDAE